jgi:hypothetical protein
MLSNVNLYYQDLLNRVTVQIRALSKPKETCFTLQLAKHMMYDDVTAKIAFALSSINSNNNHTSNGSAVVNPATIRLTGHHRYACIDDDLRVYALNVTSANKQLLGPAKTNSYPARRPFLSF